MNRPEAASAENAGAPRGVRKPEVPPPPKLTPSQIKKVEEWVEANLPRPRIRK